ncbi:hypothetical protein KYK30_20450 [Shinella yambaruensis]|uniref:Uncharacterized protein n=1 Tax=Shinella yambaruensis TaxID=415996 RepID=A0ABQ5ZF21_9HYPH|nr:hypothetical protein [Shinella yambaruensis]MCJ8027035.1 hypothetical protein [Shinella yambaruensis]MCU7982074.1 hypothetical protein [Shinella yambaruensis]GLR51248.1 hypothetical protein GCM10007923_24560 [Shinella yambaruensis]
MSDAIPADVMKVAEKAFKYGFGLRYEVAIEAIAKAILAERERCARIAEEHRDNRPLIAHQPSSLVIGRYEGEQAACTEVARLIRVPTGTSGAGHE